MTCMGHDNFFDHFPLLLHIGKSNLNIMKSGSSKYSHNRVRRTSPIQFINFHSSIRTHNYILKWFILRWYGDISSCPIQFTGSSLVTQCQVVFPWSVEMISLISKFKQNFRQKHNFDYDQYIFLIHSQNTINSLKQLNQCSKLQGNGYLFKNLVVKVNLH